MTEEEMKVKQHKTARRILAHYRQYQKTGDKDRIVQIQRLVDEMGRPFILKIENPPAQVTFRPKLFDVEEESDKISL